MKGSSNTQCIVSDCVSIAGIVKDNVPNEKSRTALHESSRINSTVPNPLKNFSSFSKDPLFKTRKRSINKVTDDNAMSSYNSAFLCGLFADIAKATNTNEEPKSKILMTKDDILLDGSRPNKKSRVSLTKSISRCDKSFANLMGISLSSDAPTTKISARDESLHHQLHCISSSSSTESDSLRFAADVGKLAFPHLPNTVSDSSCSQFSVPENSTEKALKVEVGSDDPKEAYGWFVNTDVENDDQTATVVPPQSSLSKSVSDLAFTAMTAPKVSSQEAEVEWAKAADTVDDVLGDFF